MAEIPVLLDVLHFVRDRTLATLEEIEKSGQADRMLAFRPGVGRAHVGWQFLHLAATDDRMLNVRFRGAAAIDPELVAGFAGGSTPADDNVPTPARIRQALTQQRSAIVEFLREKTDAELDRVVEVEPRRTLRIWTQILIWHEAHHQGQIHLSLNLFKANSAG